MKFFRARHNLKTDYSGYQEASPSLRNRLNTVCQKYITEVIAVVTSQYWIPIEELEHELAVNLEKSNIEEIIFNESYDYVFEAVEVYLVLAKKFASNRFYDEILPNIQRAFDLSGSVYLVNENGEINLRVDVKLAEGLQETQAILSRHEKSYNIFFDSVGKLMSRKDEPKNIVKDIFIAFENYLKEISGKKDFGKVIDYLRKQEILTATQKSLLEKIYAYRSDAFAVGHAGGSREPDELDTFWFLETVIAQLKFIDRKLKQTTS